MLVPINTWGQSTHAPFNKQYYHLVQRYEIKHGKFLRNFHTNVQPYQREDIAALADTILTKDSTALTSRDLFNLNYLRIDNWEWSQKAPYLNEKPFLKIFYKAKSDFYHVHNKTFDLHLNPVLYLSLGNEWTDSIKPYTNTRGIEVRGIIGQKVGFYSYIGENQAVFPNYVRTNIKNNTAVPNEGFWKTFKSHGVDFLTARGYISFNAIKQINIKLGHDRNFWGNGYRSLILSDYANSYFFLKLNTQVWRINYTNLYTEMYADAYAASGLLPSGNPFPKKYITAHHLSINLTNNINIGLFESIIFGEEDSLGRNPYNFSYLNPIIFYRAIEHSSGSKDNAIVGIDFKANFLKRFSLYGQIVLDEFLLKEIKANSGWWANKYALQIGIKYIDAFFIPHLDIQVETNWIRPYAYAHRRIFTHYAHYRQPLAHPLGANFKEIIGIIRYQPSPKTTLNIKCMFANIGLDTLNSNWGQNILLNYNTRMQDYDNIIGQGATSQLSYLSTSFTYQLFHNLFIDIQHLFRQQKSIAENLNNTTHYTNLSLRWNIAKRLHEF